MRKDYFTNAYKGQNGYFGFGLVFKDWYVDLSWVAYVGFATWKASEIVN